MSRRRWSSRIDSRSRIDVQDDSSGRFSSFNNEVIYMNTKIKTLLNALSTGASYSDAEIKSSFGIASAKSAARTLQMEGYPVYANKTGRVTTYRLGSPSRRVVAAGYASLAA